MNKLRLKFPCRTACLSIFSGLLLIGYLGGCTSDVAYNKSEAQTKFQEGLQHGSINDPKAMIASFQEAVELEPENEQYRIHLGRAHYIDGDLENAEKEFKQALKINKDSKIAYRQLGRLYLQTGDWQNAAQNFEADLERPGTVKPHRVYNWLALSYYNQGNFDQAERQWLKALDLKDNAAIRLNLALAYKDQERFDQAMDSLKKAVVLNPKFPQAHFEISQLFILNKEMNQAVRHFNKVIQLAPKSEWARLSKKYLDLIQHPKN
jgi:tetratricopeptide (TPR) repeat protein